MNKKYIDKFAAIEAVDELKSLVSQNPFRDELVITRLDQLRFRILLLPAADVQEVRHGKWIMHVSDLFPADSTRECDQCHEEQPLTCDDNFCPHCGAKMEDK